METFLAAFLSQNVKEKCRELGGVLLASLLQRLQNLAYAIFERGGINDRSGSSQ
jgi:hypothetical protein